LKFDLFRKQLVVDFAAAEGGGQGHGEASEIFASCSHLESLNSALPPGDRQAANCCAKPS
jgi:hypothetical protein